jgi:hypothetical protein
VLERVTEFNWEKMHAEYGKVNWGDKDTIYSCDFIPDLYEYLTKVARITNNEEYVEGKRITPDWYYCQQLTSIYLTVITEKISDTINFFNKYLLPIAAHFDKATNPLLASFAAQIGTEIIHKIRYRIDQLKPVLDDIDKMEICKGEFPWVKPNFDEIAKRLNSFEEQCFRLISENIGPLSLVKWNNQYPDVFARSYSILSSNLNECLGNGKILLFKKNFPEFLKSAIAAFNNNNEIFKGYAKPQNISYQTLVDAMQLSGYAYVYSAIYKNPDYWQSTKAAWDEVFDPSAENIEILIRNYSYYKNSLYGTGINFDEEQQRKLMLSRVVEKLNISPSSIDDFLVRPFIPESYHSSYYNIAELFIEVYLFTYIEAKKSTALFGREFFKYWSNWLIKSNNRNDKRDR